MAQANFTPVSLYYSTNAAAVPSAANLTNGELAINIASGRLYYKNSSGTVVVLADQNAAAIAVPVRPSQGGTGVVNNDSSTLTISGNFGTTLTVTGSTAVTLPTSGTLATLAGNETLSNKTLSNVTGNNVTLTNLTATTVNFNGGTSNGVTHSNVTIVSGTSNAMTINNSTVNNPQINAYTEGITTGYANTGNAFTINIVASTIVTANLTANCTFTMPSNTAGKSFILFLKTGAGNYTGTFTGVKFVGNTAPTITTTANRMDILTFTADGQNWYGNYAQGYNPN